MSPDCSGRLLLTLKLDQSFLLSLVFYLGIEENWVEWVEKRKNERKTKLPPGHTADTVCFSVTLMLAVSDTHFIF